MGAIRVNDFLRSANGCGQAGGDHLSSRIDPDNAVSSDGAFGCPSLGRARSPMTVAIARRRSVPS